MPLGDYELVELVAKTNMSEVWRATDSRTGKQIAVKKRPKSVRAERRFAREINAQIAAAGTHTMPILDFDEDLEWYVMPWAEKTLAEHPVPAPALVSVVLEAIAESLRPIHATGQVHRDLKPQNVLWLVDNSPGRWVVADFGIVRNASGGTTSTLTARGGALGSYGWMAPEQNGSAHAATPRTDVYAAGAIMAWLLSGDEPGTTVPLPNASPSLRSVVWKATRPRPGERYDTLDALATAARTASLPRTVGLHEHIEARRFNEILAFGLDGSRYPELVEELPALSAKDVAAWFAEDAAGAREAIRSSLQGMRDDGIGDLAFAKIDRFLSWVLLSLTQDLKSGHRDDAEQTASSLFGAIAEIHQFAPARDALDWMDTLSTSDQDAMETALNMADAWSFFEAQASDRFVTSRTTSLVRRLSRS